MVGNQAILCNHRLAGATTLGMTGRTRFAITVDLQCDQIRIIDMIAARPMTRLTANAILSPCPDQARQVSLMTFRNITSCVATAAVVRFFLARVIRRPIIAGFQAVILQIILRRGLPFTGDDVAFFVNEARLPAITADHIQNIIPGVTFRWFFHFRKRISGRLAIHHFI